MEKRPRAFICHASEDKSRFVLGFATKLRERGIDAWVDEWEILPSDSIEQRIFAEGVESANAVVIVISEFSINKPWIRRELDAALVSRIKRGTKLIPILLDNSPVPQALSDVAWQPIANLDDYQAALERVVAAIFGSIDKPQCGPAPPFTGIDLVEINGLSAIDNLVLKIACEAAIQTGDHQSHSMKLYFRDGKATIPEGELIDSLQMLAKNNLVELSAEKVLLPRSFRITGRGFDAYARAYMPRDYEELQRRVVSAIVNGNAKKSLEIQSQTGFPLRLIDAFLDILEMAGQINLYKTYGGTNIYSFSPSLKRGLV